MHVTVIVPFHRDIAQLAASLAAVRRSMPDAQIVLAADGAQEEYQPLAEANRAEVVVVPGPSGPAVARNRAAALASGKVLVFVDSDVVVAPDAIPGICALLDREPGVAAVFGAYDRRPPARNFMSQFKNLSHAYVHETGNPEASTFWAGLGAVRTETFRSVGGFDERFGRPSVEDIDLGYRIRRAGHRLRLDPRFRGAHLKRWTLLGCVRTDLFARGVPWTQLIRRFHPTSNDLNLNLSLRLSVVVSYLLVAASVTSWFALWAFVPAIVSAAALVGLNFDYYRWFARHRGPVFAVMVFPVHLLHHLCNGISFVTGTLLFLAGTGGIRLPGVLPQEAWSVRLISTHVTPSVHS
jgi:glycosyltransferase involved in cell wall biosynthesis